MESEAIVYNLYDENKLNEEILWKLKLDDADTISVLFFLNFNKQNALELVIDAFKKSKKNRNFWSKYLIDIPQWKNILFEALILIQNILFFKTKYTNSEINNFTNFRCMPTYFINAVVRDLYSLCDMLVEKKVAELLDKVYIGPYEKRTFEFMELHVLYWMQIGFIKIIETDNGTKGDFSRLLQILKSIDLQDSIPAITLSNLNIESFGTVYAEHNVKCQLKKYDNLHTTSMKKNHLCIIINEENYVSPKIIRKGSKFDLVNLYETFTGCNFEVVQRENLNFEEFNSTIREIPKKYKNQYDTIVLCILSHGEEGGILTCDDKFVCFQNIKKKLCQPELEDVLKIVIAQCCQGHKLGIKQRDKKLSTDGFSYHEIPKEEIAKHANFVLWKATLENFKAFRDPESGTWFIQVLCHILKHEQTNRTLFDLLILVNEKLKQKVGEMDGLSVGQMSEMDSVRLNKAFIFPPYKADINN